MPFEIKLRDRLPRVNGSVQVKSNLPQGLLMAVKKNISDNKYM